MKKPLNIIAGIIVLSFIIIAWCNKSSNQTLEQNVYQDTINISKTYIGLRNQTETLLLNAWSYSYNDRNENMTNLIKSRENIAIESEELEKNANNMAIEISSSIISKVMAYDRNEISNVFDKAPAGKKIATLAKHLWVDAKTAFKILRNDQAQVEADAWNEAWDTFQKLETSATVIKDGCKVAGYVWGIAVWWGVAALAGKSLLTQAAVIVWWADLVLEVTDDGAKIALGNHNKISSIVSDVRTVTEPVANILTITDIPNNLETWFEKFTAVMVALESFRWTAQEWKILWVELPAYEKTEKFANIKKYKAPVYVSVINKEDIDTRLKDTKDTNTEKQWKSDDEMLEDIIKATYTYIKNSKTKSTKDLWGGKIQANTNNTNNMVGTRKWDISRTSSSSADPETIKWEVTFKEDNTVDASIFESRDYEDDEWENDVVPTWTKEGNVVRIYNADFGNDNNYFEFNLQWDTLIFIKLVWPDSEWEWDEWLAGSDFFGWKFFEWNLKRQK